MFLISTDNIPSQREWAGQLGVSFPILSDFANRKVASAYGVLNQQWGVANRTTFVIGPDGRIQHIEEGKTAVDPAGALTACQRARH